MTATPKYDPPDDEPRLVAYTDDDGCGLVDVVDEHGVHRPHSSEFQRIALAIADRVHGPELARLRAVLVEVHDAVGTYELGTDLDGRIRELLSLTAATSVPEAVGAALLMAVEHLEMAELSARALECPRVAVQADELAMLLAAWKATQR